MNTDCVVPDWLHDIILGYGDPSSAHYSKMPNQIEGEDAAMLIDAISTPLNVKICYRSGKTEELDIPQVSNNMCYELNAFIGLIQTKQVDHKWNEISVMEMQLLDEVRRQQNIVFPADQK